MTIVEKYTDLKAQKDALTIKLAQEEATFKTLKSQYDDKVNSLKTKFGVSSIEEAEELLKKMSEELEEKLKKAEDVLAVFGNGDLTL